MSSNNCFKDDTLCNALIECEKVINSRPLAYIDLETGADEALTPNHFLLGSSKGNKPLAVFNPDDLICVQEYLPILNKRTKWFSKSTCLEVGDVVIVVDPNLPRNSWPMGRIEAVHKGRDENVRSATVRSKNAVYTRAVAKLAKLDVKPN